MSNKNYNENIENIVDTEENNEIFKMDDSQSPAFVMKEDKLKDLTHSIFIFLFFSVLITFVVIIASFGYIGILNPVSKGALICFGISMIYLTIYSYIQVRKLRPEALAEKEMSTKINHWLTENIDNEFIKNNTLENTPQELMYYHISDMVTDMIIEEFEISDRSYIEKLFEDYYSRNFE